MLNISGTSEFILFIFFIINNFFWRFLSVYTNFFLYLLPEQRKFRFKELWNEKLLFCIAAIFHLNEFPVISKIVFRDILLVVFAFLVHPSSNNTWFIYIKR